MSHQPPHPSPENQNITQEPTTTENPIELNEKLNGASNEENVKIIEESPSDEKANTDESKQGENNDAGMELNENEVDGQTETEEGTVEECDDQDHKNGKSILIRLSH